MDILNRSSNGPRSVLPWRYNIVLVLIGMLSWSTAEETTVELTGCDCGPKREELQSIVSYCPELNYTVVLECRVKGSLSFRWNISELNIHPEFSPAHNNTTISDGIFTFNIIKEKKENSGRNSYTSQLLVYTSDLRDLNRSSLTVICQATSETKKMLLVQITDGTSPEILNANFTGPKLNTRLNITWMSRNTDIIKIEVFWENAHSNIKNSKAVEWYKKNVLIEDIDSSISYNVTVVEHNKCEEQFTSKETFVRAHEMQPPPTYEMKTSPALIMSTVSVCNEECLTTPTPTQTSSGPPNAAGGGGPCYILFVLIALLAIDGAS